MTRIKFFDPVTQTYKPIGQRGLSAYQVWLKEGHVGSEDDFLDSLKGEQGLQGKSAYEIWLEEGNEGTEENFLLSLKGADGEQGVQGEPGEDGSPGVNGEDGEDGQSAYETWLSLGNVGTEEDFINWLKSGVLLLPIEKTYAQMVAMISASELVPGQEYIITDYQTIHIIPNTSDTNTGDTEPLKVKANGVATLEAVAYSALFPQDIIYYDFNNNQDMVPGCEKGYIYRRVDTKQNNDFPFDFRNVKFRRWQIDVDAWDEETEYSIGSVVHRTTGTINEQKEVYVSLKNSNEGNAVTNTDWWRRFEFDNLSYISPYSDSWDRSDEFTFVIPCSSLYVDYNFFAVSSYYESAFNNKIDAPLNGLIENNNTVIFGIHFFNNSIGAYFQNNSIVDFLKNSIGSNFYNNSIGLYFYNNLTLTEFYNNSIADNFYNNSIGANFFSNLIGSNFQNNSIRDNFYYNSIKSNFQYNSIGSNFQSNSIKAYFSYNLIRDNFFYNSIESNFQNNSIESYFNNNSIGSYFQFNSGSCNWIDFTLSSYVYEDMSCQIIKTESGTYKLLIVDENDQVAIVDVDA